MLNTSHNCNKQNHLGQYATHKAFPNARNTDPSTSIEAGEQVELSGNAHFQRELALDAVKRNPGLTSKELSQATGIDRYQLARRLPELTEVKQGDKRICAVSGRPCVTWVLL